VTARPRRCGELPAVTIDHDHFAVSAESNGSRTRLVSTVTIDHDHFAVSVRRPN
jgi:hypothetical protein